MASRSRLLPVFAAFCSLPGLVFAQAASPAAPPEVDKALRANVTEFFQDFVDKKYRQALNLVAEDTQDEYFGSQKADIKAFKFDAIDYSNNFTEAVVKLSVTQVWKMKAEGFLEDSTLEAPMETTWKIENGKWVWYHHASTEGHLTPMGLSSVRPPSATPGAPPKIDNDSMMAEAHRILQQSQAVTEVTPKEVTLAPDKPSSTKVTFHNGAPGSLSLSVAGVPKDMPGFSATLNKQLVNAGEDAIVEIRYEPASDHPAPPASLTLAVIVEPFNQGFPVVVNFTPAKQ